MPSSAKMSACGAAVMLVFGLGGTNFAHAATLDEYRSLVTECRRTVESRNLSKARIQNLSRRLSAIETVTYPGGTSVKIDTRRLIAALNRSPFDPSIRQQIKTHEALLTASSSGGAKEDPRVQAKTVLSASEFSELRKPPKGIRTAVPNWWTRFTRWFKETAENFSDWLKNLLRNRQRPAAPDSAGVQAFVRFLQFLLWFIVAVAALVGLYLLARAAAARGWLDVLRNRRRRGGISDADLDLSGDGIADPLVAARELAARGAYRDAVRMAYIASLRRLQENGLLVLEPNKTNWEYQRDLSKRSRSASDILIPATRLFDRVWYGRRMGTAAEFSEAVRVHDALAEIAAPSASETQEASDRNGEGEPV